MVSEKLNKNSENYQQLGIFGVPSVFSQLNLFMIWIMCNMATVGRHSGGRHVDQVLTDMSVDISADTRSTCRPTVGQSIGRYVGRHAADTFADMLRLTVGGVSVDWQWYRSIVHRCFAEIAAISLPTGDAKKDPISYARMLTGQGAAQTVSISNTYLFAVLLEGIRGSSREIAGFTEQGTAFTRAQSAILQNRD